MKLLLAVLTIVALAYAEDTVDWSKVKPAWTRLNLPEQIKFPEDWSTYWDEHFANGRIVGGDEAEPNSIPFQAAILATTAAATFFCGGTLISTTYVLTAAHCLDGVVQIEVRLGAHIVNQVEATQIRRFTTTFVQHVAWNANLLINDIAVIQLDEPVPTSAAIQVVPLPRYSDVGNSFSGITARVSGWGADSDSSTVISPVLRQVAVDVITNFICNIQFLGVVENTHICTSGSGGRGACGGDSGGPLVVGNMQIGTVSFGLALGCEIGWPTVYTRLTSYLDWIAANTNVNVVP